MEIQSFEIRYRDQILHIEYFIRSGHRGTILYLHGLGCSKNDFIEAIDNDKLKVYTLVSFDFPGSGGSSYPQNIALNIDDLVEITNIIVTKLSLRRFIVIGHSMGGLVALLYIQRYGKTVKGFISVESNMGFEDCTFSRRITKCTFKEFQGFVFQDFIKSLYQSKNNGFRKYAETLERYSYPKALFDYCPSLVSYSDRGDLIQRFTELSIPKAFIYGSENRTFSSVQKLKDRGLEVIEIANSNHFPGYDNPRDFYNVVSSFLKDVH